MLLVSAPLLRRIAIVLVAIALVVMAARLFVMSHDHVNQRGPNPALTLAHSGVQSPSSNPN
ncbi:MAG: hypothetical protein ACYCTG_00780 [Ferrimicrobium sp.]